MEYQGMQDTNLHIFVMCVYIRGSALICEIYRKNMALSPEQLCAKLDEMQIIYQYHEHQPLHTVEDSQKFRGEIEGGHCKNLFLKTKKGQLFLIVVLEDCRVDLKQLEKIFAVGRISFGKPELLMEKLGVEPGSVTPFAALNDLEKEVTVVLDKSMLEQERLNYHPLVNTATVTLGSKDLLRFIVANHKEPMQMHVPQKE